MRGSGIRSSHEGTDPESVSEEAEKNTPEGEVASEYMKNLLEGGSVYLEYDSELTDTYGRTLCYVYLHDKAAMAALVTQDATKTNVTHGYFIPMIFGQYHPMLTLFHFHILRAYLLTIRSFYMIKNGNKKTSFYKRDTVCNIYTKVL